MQELAMKKFLLMLAIIGLLIIAGVAIFILTFDANRYRPMVVEKLESALGLPVQLDRIELSWDRGIAIGLQGVAIGADADSSVEPLLQVDSASGHLELKPLLQREVQISSVVLECPRIYIKRDARGQVNLLGLASAASPVAASAGQMVEVGGTAVSFHIESVRIKEGTIHWTDTAVRPPLDLRLKAVNATVRNISPDMPMDIDITAAFSSKEPNVRLSGRLRLPEKDEAGSVENLAVSLERIPLDQISPRNRQGNSVVTGDLSAKLEGGLSSLQSVRAMASGVSGRGNVGVSNLVIKDFNILRAVFDQLSMIPGLVDTLEQRLPETHRAKLAARDTAISSVELSSKIAGDILQFDDIKIRSDEFELDGSGKVGLDGGIRIPMFLRIDPAFSLAIIESVNELQVLTNSAGWIELPLMVHGHLPTIRVTPDLNYIAQRLIRAKAVDVLQGLFKKKEEPSAETESPSAQSGEGAATGAREGADKDQNKADLLNTILQRVLEPKSSQGGKSPAQSSGTATD